MPYKQPLKITDRRRQADPPKIRDYQRPGGYTSYLSAVLGRGDLITREPGMGVFNDRRQQRGGSY